MHREVSMDQSPKVRALETLSGLYERCSSSSRSRKTWSGRGHSLARRQKVNLELASQCFGLEIGPYPLAASQLPDP